MTLDRRETLGALLGLAAAVAAAPANAGPAPAGERLTARTPDGLSLSVHSHGAAGRPEILFVHGLGQCRLSWTRQVESALAERFRLVAYDLRGHGDSDKPAEPAAYGDGALWADDLRAVIETAGLRRPILVGWSLGGLVIGHYLARHGNGAVAGVNLVDAVTKLSPDLLTPLSREYAGRLASADLGARAEAIEKFLALCFARPPAPAELRRMLVFNGMVPRAVQEGVVKISNAGLDEAFAAVPRALVTHGAKDRLVTREMSRRILDLNPRARLSLYADAGHAPFYESAARFNAELAAFAAQG